MLLLGKRLRNLRQQNKLSLNQVSELTGLSEAAIEAYEIDRNNPPADVLVKLAKIYKTTTDYILGISQDKTINLENLTEQQKLLLTDIIRDTTLFLSRN